MVKIPDSFKNILQDNNATYASILTADDIIAPWFYSSGTPFFPDYTDHGTRHLEEVIETADKIIKADIKENLTADDIAALIASIMLHDSAMHLNEDGFYQIIQGRYIAPESSFSEDNTEWSQLWRDFIHEAKNFNEEQHINIFGKAIHIKDIPEDKGKLTRNDRLLIGEFIRRHHARMAHEFALHGIPNGSENIEIFKNIDTDIADIWGFIAHSHHLDLREAVDKLGGKDDQVSYRNIHIPFIMVLLRIADYIQIHSSRANSGINKEKHFYSPISKCEWRKHQAIYEVKQGTADQEALRIGAKPKSAVEYENLQNLFRGIQQELDKSWAVLGEIYGNVFGITIRRIRSNLDDKKAYIKRHKPDYIANVLKFQTSETQMIELMIEPLYGARPEVGIRELMQNAVDACLEYDNIAKNNDNIQKRPEHREGEVIITLDNSGYNSKAIIEDYGVGMTMKVIENYFLNIGASFRNSHDWKKEHQKDGSSNIHRTGRFGVGLLAAYLLGDKIHVTTRHYTETDKKKAISFTCHKGQKNIESKYTTLEHCGTKIEIDLSKDIINSLIEKHEDWDWFVLKTPKVIRKIITQEKEKTLKQKYYFPNTGEDLNNTSWHRIQAEKYKDIMWNLHNHPEKILACNGIKILSIRVNVWGENRNFFNELQYSPVSPSFKLPALHLNIFDLDGNFPLNLQRDDLSAVFPFSKQFLRDISDKGVNEIIKKTKKIGKIHQNIQDIKSSYLSHPSIYSEPQQFMYVENSVVPIDAHLIKAISPRKILVDLMDRKQFEKKIFNKEYYKNFNNVLPYPARLETPSEQYYALENILFQSYENWKEFFSTEDMHLLVQKSTLNDIDEGKHYNDNDDWDYIIRILNDESCIEWENSEWALYEIGYPPPIDLNMDEVTAELDKKNSFGFAIYYYDPDEENQENFYDADMDNLSPFAEAWLEKNNGKSALELSFEEKVKS